ncbi:palmitoyl-protein thioesterase [Ceratobasidium sp. AG-Ba]|nr:palmitoyl-protein thioesterase [Ceratobasidium sp. AG-Ba]
MRLLLSLFIPCALAVSLPGSPYKLKLDKSHDLETPAPSLSGNKPHPLVLWHGLGDSAHSEGMDEFADLIKRVHPGIFVHSVSLADDQSEDRKAGWFGEVNTQIDTVASQLSSIPELSNGFDAIGFSQGGQFLRAYVERYNSPPVRSLLTFGSQHMGVSGLPGCKTGDFLCWLARNAALRGVYTSYAQTHIIQAQYFRDPRTAHDLESYHSSNTFLTDINGELDIPLSKYKKNIESLDALVLVLFSEDRTVVPKESGWFGSFKAVNLSEPDSSRKDDETIVPIRQQPIYTTDAIGLRTLDNEGKIRFVTCEGAHMRISDECWKPLVLEFCGDRRGAKAELMIQA